MATDDSTNTVKNKSILIIKNGPYVVKGDVPLVSKTQVVSEYGEPLTWQKEGKIPVSEGEYHLCRCGLSSKRPFCDGNHRKAGFVSAEPDANTATGTRKLKIPRGTRIFVTKDASLCMQSGYCGFSDVGLNQLVAATQDTKMRALIMAMIERCPSGALTYRLEADGADIEPDFPEQIAITTEITSEGPIVGPLWVTGAIPIARSDGQPFETRNRVTLCNCGHSCNKPLCDGTHREMAERETKRSRGADR